MNNQVIIVLYVPLIYQIKKKKFDSISMTLCQEICNLILKIRLESKELRLRILESSLSLNTTLI